MKRGISWGMFAVLTALILLAINAMVFYYANCTGDYVQTSDIYGRQESESRTENRRVREILAQSENIKEQIESRTEFLTDVIDAVTLVEKKQSSGRDEALEIISEYTKNHSEINLSELSRQASAEKAAYERALKKLDYAGSYGDYIKRIAQNAADLSEISLFGNKRWIRNNIIKTQKDFYGLDNISISATVDNAPGVLVNYHITDIFSLLTVFIIIPFFVAFSSDIKSKLSPNRRLLAIPVISALFLSAAMYTSDFLLTEHYVGEIQTGAAIQSYEAFRSCPYAISVGQFLLICMTSKLAGILVFSFMLLFILCTLKRSETDRKFGKKNGVIQAVIPVLFFALSALAHLSGDFGTVLQEVNLFSLFTFERFFIRYLNLNILGMAASRVPIMIAFAVLLSVIFSFAMHQSVSRFILSAGEAAEQEYYDEINRRYTESRKIKHDINNHLLAVSRLIESGNIEGARKYISEVAEKTELSAQPVKTGSGVLDALLYKKSGQAEASGIKLDTEISAPVPKSVSDYDLCTIFGNILDNAFEALNNGNSEKLVKLKMSGQHEMYYISCENPFSGEIRRENGKILTRKSDKETHGYGLARVSEIAAKYGGTVNITDKEGFFRIEILINSTRC